MNVAQAPLELLLNNGFTSKLNMVDGLACLPGNFNHKRYNKLWLLVGNLS
jgi:hypothetical protein